MFGNVLLERCQMLKLGQKMSHKTILDIKTAEITEKRSRFISCIAPVDSEDAALKFISNIKNKHRDARHNVYAYALSGGCYKYSDDGEPQGTAGPPILEIIKSKQLLNCVIVVTRYFGGILLGTGGLVRAYSQAAKLVISKSKIVELVQYQGISFSCDYKNYDRICMLIQAENGIISKSDFLENIQLEFYIPAESSDEIVNKFKGFGIDPIKIVFLDKKYMSIN